MSVFWCPSRRQVRRVLTSLLLGLLVWPTGGHAQSDGLSPGAKLPSIESPLQKLDGSSVSVNRLLGETGTVFLFWSNQCPWVDRYEGRVKELAQTFRPSGVQFVLINANDVSRAPQESLKARRERAEEPGYQIRYVQDREGGLARTLGAARTPHAFVFDAQRILVYGGAIDDSPSDADRVRQSYLRDALSALLDGRRPDVRSTEPFGCMLNSPE